jgi:hypothetical protein
LPIGADIVARKAGGLVDLPDDELARGGPGEEIILVGVGPHRRIGRVEAAPERLVGREDPALVDRREIEILAGDGSGDIDALPEDQPLRPNVDELRPTRCVGEGGKLPDRSGSKEPGAAG